MVHTKQLERKKYTNIFPYRITFPGFATSQKTFPVVFKSSLPNFWGLRRRQVSRVSGERERERGKKGDGRAVSVHRCMDERSPRGFKVGGELRDENRKQPT